jgi:hypothetical protein
MFQVLTLPQWECRAPEPFRRRGEAYWTCAELPLSDGWSFLVKVDTDQTSQLPARTIFVVSIEKLLHCLVELGPRAVRSVHQVSMGAPDDDDALVFNRITRIEVGEDPHNGWRKVYACHSVSTAPIVNVDDHESMGRLQNRVVVAHFPEPRSAAPDLDHVVPQSACRRS